MTSNIENDRHCTKISLLSSMVMTIISYHVKISENKTSDTWDKIEKSISKNIFSIFSIYENYSLRWKEYVKLVTSSDIKVCYPKGY